MHISDIDLINEKKWLQDVISEVQKQLDENQDSKEKYRQDYVETQREMWQDVGSVSISNGLDQIVDFMQFVDTMKTQKRSHEATVKLEKKYERMLLSPYFGRFDFIENGKDTVEKCYIGVSNLSNEDCEFLIYDWRAPISSMYYDYEIGCANYKCPEGTIEGSLSLKRQYKISDGEIEYMFDSNLKIDDEILQDILRKSTDHKMKAIVTTIQREQNRIIRNEAYKNLIVQGPAGSGKTSVALHRIAYLLYKHRDKIKPQNILIFSPNDIFNDYISNVLPQLGEDNMHQTTFKDYMQKALGAGFEKENYYQMMAYILSDHKDNAYKNRMDSIKLKSSVEFIAVLKQYVYYLENNDRDFRDIIFNGRVIISAKTIQKMFFKDYANLPLKKRLLKMKDRILFLFEPYERVRKKEIVDELYKQNSHMDKREIKRRSAAILSNEKRNVYDEVNRITSFDLMGIYRQLFSKLDHFSNGQLTQYNALELDKIKTHTIKNLNARRLNYEDQPPLLYLKGITGDLPETTDIKYVIIDEAQDYTPLQYEIFYQLFSSASMTMLGDLNQSINPYMNVGSYENIAHIFPVENTCQINLTKSYRSTMEITQFSRQILPKSNLDESVNRSGEKPLVLGFENEEAIESKLLEDIKVFKEKGYQSIGIVTRTVSEARKVHHFLKDKVAVKAIFDDEDEYVNDTLVIPAYLAKGLEFDVVILFNAGSGNYNCEEERLLLYTACTRALHVLHIYYSGKITYLLEFSLNA